MDERRQGFSESSFDRQSDLTEGQDARRYGFAQKHDSRVDQMMQMLMDGGGGDMSSSTSTVDVGGGGAVVGGVAGGGAGVSPAGAAADAGYARLKEREGQRLRGAINTTKGALGRRGLTGSSFESPAIAALVGESSGKLADFDAAALADTVGRSRQIEDRNFAATERRREHADSRKDARMQALMALIGNGPAY